MSGFSDREDLSDVRTKMNRAIDRVKDARDYGLVGDGSTDNTSAFWAMVAGGGTVFFPAGTYRLDFNDGDGALPDGLSIVGVPGKTIITPYTSTARGVIGTDNGSSSTQTEDLTFDGLTFLGQVASLGHNGYAHLLYLSSVRRVKIENCRFLGSRGDCIAIESGFGGGPSYERHNYDIEIQNCHFDGVIYGADGGRNGISVIDVDGLDVHGCTFENMSKNNMPGSIDLEPNENYSVIKNVKIHDNNFRSCAGNKGHVVIAPDNTVHANIGPISVCNNDFAGCDNDNVHIIMPESGNGNGPIRIYNNNFGDCASHIKKVTGNLTDLFIYDNVMRGSGTVRIGDNSGLWSSNRVRFMNNDIDYDGLISTAFLDNISALRIGQNTFSGSTQAHVRLGAHTMTDVDYTGNQYIGSPSGGNVIDNSL